jgi:hypothetical protein
MFVDGEFGGVKASTLRGSYATDRLGVMDWVFREKFMSACPTPTRCNPLVAPFLPQVRHGYPTSTSIDMSGETVGPPGPGNNVVDFFLEGAAWYVTIRCWERGGTSLESAPIADHRHLGYPSLSPFFSSFLLGVCLLFHFETLVVSTMLLLY